jgi:hypothetical protein
MFRLTGLILIAFLLWGCALIREKDDAPFPSGSPQHEKQVFPGYDNNAFLADVTIPDGMEILPGDKFEKLWRVRNTGDVTWKDYRIVFIRGDLLDAPYEAPVPTTPPGREVDIKVPMKAPSLIGAYKGYWMMKNNKGALFGDTLWVDIKAKD